jgi:hypothetical protein
MTVAEKIAAFIKARRPLAFCDDCLGKHHEHSDTAESSTRDATAILDARIHPRTGPMFSMRRND